MKPPIDISVTAGTGADAGRVVITCNGRYAKVPYQAARSFARDLVAPERARDDGPTRVVVHENGHVDVLLHGSIWFDGSSADILRIGQSVHQVAGYVDEQVNAPQVIEHQGIGLRGGFEFQLSSDPKILAEGLKHARDDRDLRRYLPSSQFLGRAQLAIPKIVQHPVEPLAAAKARARELSPERRRELRLALKESLT